MKFSRWLYGLSRTDHLIIFIFFLIGLGLSYWTIISLRFWHEKIHEGQKYAHEVRITPFALVGIAFLYTTILYMSIGESVTRWVLELAR
ncbi:MAG TPA: hypothetical protein EYO27_01295 [Candidatus Marinimicrobia bacterium]|nr:hypothetical protein [Candidatus Neomarinimicrobiota bacterium]HIB33633.1 hypothetical protein [Candidatus Neomarinimicrobiota bacterium]